MVLTNKYSFSNDCTIVSLYLWRHSQTNKHTLSRPMFETFNFNGFCCKTFLYSCKMEFVSFKLSLSTNKDKSQCQKPSLCFCSFQLLFSLFVLVRVSQTHNALCDFTLSFIRIIVWISSIVSIHFVSLSLSISLVTTHTKRQKTNDFDRR